MKTLHLILIFSLYISLCAFSSQYVFNDLQIREQLSHTSVSTVMQDSEGYIWIGTTNGLDRYDGYQILSYQYDPKIPDCFSGVRVKYLHELADKNIVITTENKGVYLFDKNKEVFRKITFTKDLSATPILTIAEDKRYLWLGGADGRGLLRVDKSNLYNPIVDIRDMSGNMSIIDLCVWGDELFIGTTNQGLYCHNVNSEKMVHLINRPIRVGAINRTDDNKLLLGCSSGIILLSRENGAYKEESYYTGKNVIELLEIKPDKYLVVEDNGIRIFDLKERIVNASEPFFENRRIDISSANITPDGVIWIGTWNDGVKIGRNSFFKKLTSFDIGRVILKPNVRALLKDSDGRLWIGTQKDGLFYYDTHNGSSHGISSVYDINNISCLYQDSNKKLWIGTWDQGLYGYEPRVGKLERFIDKFPFGNISSIAQYDDGKLLVGTYFHGLYKVDTKNESYEEVDLGGRYHTACISDIKIDQTNNILWLASNVGVLHCQYRDGEITNVQLFSTTGYNEPFDFFWSLRPDRNQGIWAGSLGGGLYNLKRNSDGTITQTSYSTSDGLISNNIESIEIDRAGNLWIGGNKLSFFDPATNKMIFFNEGDNLQGAHFNNGSSYVDDDGIMYFGGSSGVNFFNPNEFSIDTVVPRIAITDLYCNGKRVVAGMSDKVFLDGSVNRAQRLSLPPRTTSFSLRIAALHYGNPNNNRIAYKLLPSDNEWIELEQGQHTISFASLPIGDYTLLIRAANSHGIWNKDIRQLQIEVLPPFWKTGFAYLFYCVLGILFIHLIVRVIVRFRRMRDEIVFEQKLSEISDQKMRFFANFSHEIKTPLSLIKAPLEILMKNEIRKESIENYRIIQRNLNYIIRIVNQFLDLNKVLHKHTTLQLSEVNLRSFIEQRCYSFETLAKNNNISLKLTLPEEGLTIWLDKEKSEIVLYNILSNALKFTPENGVISVALEYDNNASRALIIIKDSGVGIREDKKNQIFDRFFSTSDERFKGTGIGLSLAKEFVELHGGRIEVESIVDVGSCFTIIFPTNLAPAEGRENMSENPEENYLDNKEIAHSTVPVSKDRKFYTLLIVEDNEDLASFMKNQLSKDYSILTASNGREALDIIGKQPNINIIVSDIMMPLINGFELCKRIKSDISTSHLPVILLTAINSEEYKLRGYEYLADAYITKPFSISELQIRIANLLRNRDKIKHLIANMGTINEIEKQSISDVDKDFLQRMFDLINSNYSDPQFDVSALAGKMAMSRSVLHVKMKAVTDVSPSELINKRRMNEAMEMIKDRKYALADIALACGFSSQSYFSKAFKKMYGESPSKYM